MNITKSLKILKSWTSKHSPEILTGIGIAGMVTSTLLAVKATPKAMHLIDKKKEEINDMKLDEMSEKGKLRDYKELDKLPFNEVIKATWKCYVPSAVTTVLSISCLIGASKVNVKRNAVLAAAYRLSETALTEYKDKVIETIGEKKEEKIREEIKKDHLKSNPVSNNQVIITEKGSTLCYDHTSGRYFKSDIDKINKAVNEINRKMNLDFYVSLNDLYSELGLGDVAIGDTLGWNSDMGLLEVNFSSQLADDGTPCLVLDFNKPPKYDFDRIF